MTEKTLFDIMPDQMRELSGQLGLTDPEELARHWSVATPEGRAWLRWVVNKRRENDEDADRLGECDILRWAFAAELVHAAELISFDITVQEAISLVDHGVTLRDIKSKPPGEVGGWVWPDIDENKFKQWQDKIKGAEKEHKDLFSVRFYDLLVVSDFHLAAGDRPSPEGITRISPTEDFHFDDTFFRFLYHCEMERQKRGGYPYELVFNGDMVDFAQIVVPEEKGGFDVWALPRLPEFVLFRDREDGDGESLSERLLEILKGEEKAWDKWEDWTGEWGDEEWERVDERWKKRVEQERAALEVGPQRVRAMEREVALNQLADACQGHPRFFQGLAWFLARGNRLVLIRGNHDPQWYWPEVQLAFVGWLWTAYEDLRRACETSMGHELPVLPEELKYLPEMTPEDFEARVNFDYSWYYYRERLAYIAHGCQHEFLNSLRYFLQPVVKAAQGTLDGPPNFSVIAERAKRKDHPRLLRAVDWLPALRVSEEEKEIDPPMGSLGLVYFVNILEIELPNFQRPEYKKVYHNWVLYRNPFLLVRLLKAGWRFLMAWAAWGCDQLRKRGQKQYATKLEAYARLTGMPMKCVKQLDETRWVKKWRKPKYGIGAFVREALLHVVPFVPIVAGIVGAIYWWSSIRGSGDAPDLWSIVSTAWSILASTVVGSAISYWLMTLLRKWAGLGEDYLFKPSQRVAHILKRYGKDVPYILFGHDHDHNAQPLGVGKWCRECGAELRRRHVRLEGVRLEAQEAACLRCGTKVNMQVLRREVDKVLREQKWPDWDMIRCPHCYQETSVPPDEDLDVELVQCGVCKRGIDLELTPQAWTSPKAFLMEPLSCRSCGELLPDEVIDKIKVIPPHVVFSCPDCGQKEWQWLGTWSPGCPVCEQRPRNRDIHLVEDRAVVHCPKCGEHYPYSPSVGRWYLNTGTWLDWFAKERKRLVRRDLEHAFVRMIDTHRVLAAGADDYMDPSWGETRPKVQLLRWNDATKRVEPCETFKGTDED
jgi:hypothetical protein